MTPDKPTTEQLKPCPFCGGTDLPVVAIEGAPVPIESVACKSCGAIVPRATEAEAITAWNTRTNEQPSALADDLDALLVDEVTGVRLSKRQFDRILTALKTPDPQVAVLREALEKAAHNLEAGDRLYKCPGLHAAAILARTALNETRHDPAS